VKRADEVDATVGGWPVVKVGSAMWILVSRNPPRIYGIDGRREWIVMRSKQGDREVQLSLTKRFFLDEVWNALVAAGAIPRSDGPTRRDRLLP
jgi:hypothetical protein